MNRIATLAIIPALLAVGLGGLAGPTLASPDIVDAGETVSVRTNTDGDAILAGRTVTLSGNAGEDALLAGREIMVSGTIGDDVFAAGQSVMVSGPVGGDVFAAGETVTIAPTARVGDDAYLAGRSIRIDAPISDTVRAAGRTVTVAGDIGGDAYLAGRTVDLSGRIGRDAFVSAETLTIHPGTFIAGDVFLDEDLDPSVFPAGVVAGTIQRDGTWFNEGDADTERAPQHDAHHRDHFGFGVWGALAWIVSLSATGAVLNGLAPRLTRGAGPLIRQQPVKIGLFGAGMLLGWPLIGVLAMVTIIGIPIGLSLLLTFGVLLLLGWLLAAFTLGDLLVASGRIEPRPWVRFGAFVLAVTALSLVTAIPLIGGVIGVIVLLMGLGALVATVLDGRRPADPAST